MIKKYRIKTSEMVFHSHEVEVEIPEDCEDPEDYGYWEAVAQAEKMCPTHSEYVEIDVDEIE